MLLLGQFGGRLVDVVDQFQPGLELLVGLDGVKCLLHLGGEGKNLVPDLQFGRLQLERGHLLPQGKDEQLQEVACHGEFLVGSQRRDVREADDCAEARVRQQPRLNEVSLGDADLLEGGLEGGIAQQGNLHRRVGGQGTAEEIAHRLLGLPVFLGASAPFDAVAGAVPDGALGVAERGRRIDRGAAREGEGGKGKGQEAGKDHCHG